MLFAIFQSLIYFLERLIHNHYRSQLWIATVTEVVTALSANRGNVASVGRFVLSTIEPRSRRLDHLRWGLLREAAVLRLIGFIFREVLTFFVSNNIRI